MENSILRTLKNFSLMERQIPICQTDTYCVNLLRNKKTAQLPLGSVQSFFLVILERNFLCEMVCDEAEGDAHGDGKQHIGGVVDIEVEP